MGTYSILGMITASLYDDPLYFTCYLILLLLWMILILLPGEIPTIVSHCYPRQMMMFWKKRFFILLVTSSLLSASFGFLDWRIKQGPCCCWFKTKSEKNHYSLFTIHGLLFTDYCSLFTVYRYCSLHFLCLSKGGCPLC